VCQNGALANSPDIEIPIERLVERYLSNPLSSAIVFGGLEPFEDIDNVVRFIDMVRSAGNNDDVVIYTGYRNDEIEDKLSILRSVIDSTASASDSEEIMKAMMRVVPTYRLPEEVNLKAQESDEMKLVSETV
jgi:hypothetical protein